MPGIFPDVDLNCYGRSLSFYKKEQREMKKRCEEMIDPKNYVGISDPTSYEAVKNIRKLQIAAIKAELLAESGKEVVA